MDHKQMEMKEEAEKEEEEEEEEQKEEEEGFLSSSQSPLHLPAMCIHNYSPHVMISLPSYTVYTVMRRNGLAYSRYTSNLHPTTNIPRQF